jgi:Uma2 family endonuclease
MLTQVASRRFSVAEFQRMARAGIFDEDDRLELLDGEVIQMNPVGRRHVATVNRLTRMFARLFAERVLISVQNPLVLDPTAEPEPDLVLLRPRQDDYELSLPTGTDAYLVVEVAETTLAYDSTRKARAYARGGVPALWVVALGRTAARDRILVFQDPAEGSYASHRQANRGDVLLIPGLTDISVAVNDFLA